MRPHDWKPKLRLLVALFAVMPLLSGCWDRLEIEQRAAVLGIAIDSLSNATSATEPQSSDLGQDSSRGSSGQEAGSNQTGTSQSPAASLNNPSTDVTGSGDVDIPSSHAMRVTAQIAVPGRIPLGPGEGGGTGGSSQSAVWILHSDGKTLNDAIQRLQQQVADRLFFGHLRVIVVSEACARQPGLRAISDALRRNPEVRRTAWLLVSKGSAYEVMKTSPPLERVPTLYLMVTLDHAMQMGKLPNIPLGSFESHSVMKGREPTLPYVEVSQQDNINVAGLAYFRGYNMVGTTESPLDVAAFMQLSGVQTGGYSYLVPVPGTKGAVMWNAYRRKERTKVEIQNGIPHYTVDVHLDGIVTGKTSDDIDLGNPEVLKKLEQEIKRRWLIHMNSVIKHTQDLDTDVIGFGEFLRARQSHYWDAYVGTKQKWEALYPKVVVTPQLSLRTHRLGMRGT